jgi:hypothetical protein
MVLAHHPGFPVFFEDFTEFWFGEPKLGEIIVL